MPQKSQVTCPKDEEQLGSEPRSVLTLVNSKSYAVSKMRCYYYFLQHNVYIMYRDKNTNC